MTEADWTGRPWAARGVRAGVLLLPPALAALAGWGMAQLVPGPFVVRLAAVGLVAVLVAVLLDRIGRRLLPLAALLELSLTFPDLAPNRFALALRAGSTRDLMAAAHRPVPDGAQAAACQAIELLAALARHDPPTRRHSERVRAYTDLLTEALELPESDRMRLRWAALLHDLGKLTVSAEVLGKAGELGDDEWTLMRLHPQSGALLAAPMQEFLGPWFDSIGQHHEQAS